MATKIISYNVNGIRAAEKKGLTEWISTNDFDVVCLQEVKATKDVAPLEAFEEVGFPHCYWHDAEKKGYSGVAVFSKIEADNVVIGCGIEKYDREGRIIRVDFGDVSILNCYFPSGTSGTIRQDFKYEFLDDFFNWIEELKKERPKLIIVGDYNIAHTEDDIHNPKSNKKSSGFLPEEREWMTKWLESGFTDAFRFRNPETIEYSWWSYRANCRANNKGWRIDYQSVSSNMKDQIVNAYQMKDAVHSDHCPVYLEIDI
ncbi:MAG: exodeoxyribonuclease III [Saprospiraceae bacterium]